jgi:hypothetical protein
MQPNSVQQSFGFGFSPRPNSLQSIPTRKTAPATANILTTKSPLTQLRQQLTQLKQSIPTLVNTGAGGATFSPARLPQIPQHVKLANTALSGGNTVVASQRLQVPKNLNAEARSKAVSSQEKQSDNAFVRRNMLMNIILRPGGGDRAKALPRPKVEVNSEGSNVILVRLTFPENENIQGLRAFTPTDTGDLEKFAELRDFQG